MKEEVYKKLLQQYNNLDDKYKNAILIYKSRLFYFINEISAVKDFLTIDSHTLYDKLSDKELFQAKFRKCASIINLPTNLFIKKAIFNSINLSNIYDFIDNMRDVYILLNEVDIYIDSELDLVRMVSLIEDKNVFISKGNLISTGLEIEDVIPFMVNKYNHLYSIKIEAGTKVLVTPYSILINLKDNTIRIEPTKKDGQHEVVLFKDDLVIEEKSSKKMSLTNDSIMIHNIETHIKGERVENNDKRKELFL